VTTVLVVDDEPIVREVVVRYLRRAGFRTLEAGDGDKARALLECDLPGLVVLDVMLPGTDGLELCRWIRSRWDLPVIMLTARGDEADRIVGLELGADDYVTKPFSVRELVSRVRANLRRANPPVLVHDGEETLAGGPVHMDIARHEVAVKGELVPFPPKEFELLEALLRRKGRLLTRDFLIEEVWGPDYFGDTKTLDVHVKRLRRKIEEDPHRPAHVVTIRGLGYKFVD
jgi:two-component system response regulator RegX3